MIRKLHELTRHPKQFSYGAQLVIFLLLGLKHRTAIYYTEIRPPNFCNILCTSAEERGIFVF